MENVTQGYQDPILQKVLSAYDFPETLLGAVRYGQPGGLSPSGGADGELHRHYLLFKEEDHRRRRESRPGDPEPGENEGWPGLLYG